jgi:prepilin-type N-terminal cleavage/methylation domain-containing protein
MNRAKAFTLIELLVSVAIFSTIAVVLYSCFRSGVISYRRIEAEAEFQQRIRHVFLRMTKDFKNMVYVSNIPFEGYSDRASFVTTITENDNADINVGRVSYYLKQGSKGHVLVREVESLKDALGLLLITEDNIKEGALKTSIKEKPAILEGVTHLKFTYLHSNADKAAGNADEEGRIMEYEWLDLWEKEFGLPLGIKIEFLVSGFKDNSRKKFYRQVSIPVGGLPNTVLAGLNVPAKEE